MNPFSSISEFKESRLLNFDGEGGAAAAGMQDGTAEPDATTPAGKKWAALREAKQTAEAALQAEREARIAAEARAAAFDEFKSSFGQPKKEPIVEPEGDIQVNPEDAKVVSAVMMKELKRMGLDKVPEVMAQLQQNTQTIQANTALERARQELEAEFASSVPFNYQETLQYAKERGYGLTFSNAKDALRLAHKEKNEQAFITYWKGGPKPKKVVPQMAASGIEDDDGVVIPATTAIDPTKIQTLDDARRLGKQLFESEEEV